MSIGVRFVKTVENGSTLFKGTMDVAYARDLTDFDLRLTTSYVGAGIDSESADTGKDAFLFGLGVDCHVGLLDDRRQVQVGSPRQPRGQPGEGYSELRVLML